MCVSIYITTWNFFSEMYLSCYSSGNKAIWNNDATMCHAGLHHFGRQSSNVCWSFAKLVSLALCGRCSLRVRCMCGLARVCRRPAPVTATAWEMLAEIEEWMFCEIDGSSNSTEWNWCRSWWAQGCRRDRLHSRVGERCDQVQLVAVVVDHSYDDDGNGRRNIGPHPSIVCIIHAQ